MMITKSLAYRDGKPRKIKRLIFSSEKREENKRREMMNIKGIE